MSIYDSDDSLHNSFVKGIPLWRTIYTTFCMLMTDTIIYGGVVPVLGVYLAGCFVKFFSFGFTTELCLSITITFLIIFVALGSMGETNYWKHLFNFEQMHGLILEIRDFVNTILLVFSVIFISHTIQAMIADKAIKQTIPVSEGIGFISLKYTILYAARLVGAERIVADSIGIKPPRAGTLTDPSFGENEVYEHGAALMLSFSMLAACICKLCYFNTLFTYLRAMEIFLSLRPSFPDDSDSDSATDDDDGDYDQQQGRLRNTRKDKNLSAGQFPSNRPSKGAAQPNRRRSNNAAWNSRRNN